jgi:hypothetical protein
MTVEQQAHQNLVDFIRWVPALDAQAQVLDANGAVGVACTSDWPASRFAARATDELPAREWADRVDGFFAEHGRTACVFARVGADDELTEVLETRGFREYGLTPEMVCDRELSVPSPAPEVSLRLARDASDVSDYARVASKAFVDVGMLEEPLRALLDNPDALLTPEVAVAVAELRGEVVAGAMSVLVGDAPHGYVGWVACLSEARGYGLGDLVTRLVTNEALQRGAAIVSLEASRFGENIYRRMGYRDLYNYRLLVKV